MLAGSVIASGFSRRFGRDKLTSTFLGRPLISWAVDAVSQLSYKSVVLKASDVKRVYVPSTYDVLVNTRASEGLSAGIKLAASWTPRSAEGLVIVLGDMPFTKPVVQKIVKVFYEERCEAVSAGLGGIPATPAVFSRTVLHKLMMLEGDVGAKQILKQVRTRVLDVDKRLLTDVDTEENLVKAEAVFKDLSCFKNLD
ncbi:MAG: nucleotidyltransferase family protein [Candidatus Caldarchaeum sp.]|nr:nucleotidyltransferase family protein [Candidatus Caldarchaeum sp.]MDW7977256.1 nucleotidyltransferase family protein [Candidatus Caldarchaeum sp.]MDW8359879.1 nucleotidyltransferase family protein [Candidatus Caldarchaeum sp.]